MKNLVVKDVYDTLEGEQLSLAYLLPAEKEFLTRIFSMGRSGMSYLNLENLIIMESYPEFSNHASRVGKKTGETILFLVCEDFATRLGIQQGFLKKEEVVKKFGTDRKELTTGDVARLAKCTLEAVRKAIRTGRLPARQVNRYSLIWEEDAKWFAKAYQKKHSHKSVPTVPDIQPEQKPRLQEAVACMKPHRCK